MARFADINDQHRKANIDTIFYYAVFFPLVDLIGAAGIALTARSERALMVGGSGHGTLGHFLATQINRSAGGNISRISLGFAKRIGSNIFNEYWPDVRRRIGRHDATTVPSTPGS